MSTMLEMIPIGEAAQKYGVSMDDIHRIMQSGRIRAGRLANGDVIVSDQDVANNLPKEQTPEYQRHAQLKGTPIGVREASRKYDVPNPTISRWITNGYIRVIEHCGRKTLVDEADVAYCAEVYHANQGQGKWLFNPDGTPKRR